MSPQRTDSSQLPILHFLPILHIEDLGFYKYSSRLQYSLNGLTVQLIPVHYRNYSKVLLEYIIKEGGLRTKGKCRHH
jgi:hypothetical protein